MTYALISEPESKIVVLQSVDSTLCITCSDEDRFNRFTSYGNLNLHSHEKEHLKKYPEDLGKSYSEVRKRFLSIKETPHNGEVFYTADCLVFETPQEAVSYVLSQNRVTEVRAALNLHQDTKKSSEDYATDLLSFIDDKKKLDEKQRAAVAEYDKNHRKTKEK